MFYLLDLGTNVYFKTNGVIWEELVKNQGWATTPPFPSFDIEDALRADIDAVAKQPISFDKFIENDSLKNDFFPSCFEYLSSIVTGIP